MELSWQEKIAELILGKKAGQGRKVYLDYLRVTATIFVVCVHTVSLAASMTVPESMSYYVLEILNFTFLSCNLLFVMISGALLLPVTNERAGTFFRKRFSKVAVPLVVYYILYICAKEGIEWIAPDHWLPMIRRILTGAPEEAPHFWLVYVILWLYVLTPFLRWVVQHIPDSVLAGVMAVIFFVNGLDTYLPVFGLDAHLSLIVDSFAGVFLLGYFLDGKCSEKAGNILIAGGILSFGVSCCLILYTDVYGQYIFQNAPTMMLFSSAIFLLVKRAAANRNHESWFTRIVSRYSFSVLLIHWGVLHFAVKQVLHVNVLSGGILGGCLLMIVLTFILSLVGAILLEHTLILLVQTVLQKTGSGFYKLVKKKNGWNGNIF